MCPHFVTPFTHPGLHVRIYSNWLKPRNSPPTPRIWAKALLVGQDRRHLLVTPWEATRNT